MKFTNNDEKMINVLMSMGYIACNKPAEKLKALYGVCVVIRAT